MARALRILIAEDDRDAATMLQMLLLEDGHEVHGVSSGRQVMGAVIDFDPDVVLLDINLPGRNGWEVARAIRERSGRQRPVLIGVSGEYKHGADRILAEVLGFDHYLIKPYPPADLARLLRTENAKL